MFPKSVSIPVLILALAGCANAADGWWNPAWTQRQKLTIDASAASVDAPLSGASVLVRLHDGNFQFANAAADGSDLRFVSADGKTLLPHHVEKFDTLLNEAYVWVGVPEIKTGASTQVQFYYGGDPSAVAPVAPSKAYGADVSLVYHFGDGSDATANGNNPSAPGTLAEGSLIGGGLRLIGAAPVVVPPSPSVDWAEGSDLTISAWVRPSALTAGAVWFQRGGLTLLIDQGVPVIEAGGARSTGGEAIAAGAWSHLALVSANGSLRLFLNGRPHSQIQNGVPAGSGPLHIGGLETAAAGRTGFAGDMDEFRIESVARDEAWLTFAAANQGTSDAAARVAQLGEVETAGGGGSGGHSAALEHVMLFGDIAKNMMFDGWIAIGVCTIMILVGWTVAFRKFAYLNSIQKASEQFLELWKKLSTDLTAIDHGDDQSIRSFGGKADPRTLALVERSPLYQIYHIGSEEIRHRLARDKDRTRGLSGRSIQAIRAALDAGLVRATHKLTNGLVYLTISIAGGPYVGLLGTVVGVMITFAIIAKSGEVDVNSIAPGIASALLATVAGLVVAIPALFIYSYLNGRIKNITAEIQVFIDEFVSKMAEFYPPAGESSPYASTEPQTSNAPH